MGQIPELMKQISTMKLPITEIGFRALLCMLMSLGLYDVLEIDMTVNRLEFGAEKGEKHHLHNIPFTFSPSPPLFPSSLSGISLSDEEIRMSDFTKANWASDV